MKIIQDLIEAVRDVDNQMARSIASTIYPLALLIANLNSGKTIDIEDVKLASSALAVINEYEKES